MLYKLLPQKRGYEGSKFNDQNTVRMSLIDLVSMSECEGSHCVVAVSHFHIL